MRGSPFPLDDSHYPLANSVKMPIRTDEAKMDSFCVTAELLIPGKGDPIKDGCIVVEGSKITKVAKASELAREFSHLPKYHVKVLMPGLWDCHIHLVGNQKIDGQAFLDSQQNMALAGARCARDCMLLLDAGFTSVREMAGYGLQLDRAIEEGSLIGPKIYSSRVAISPTGGHTDLHDLHKPWYDDACAHGLCMATADGVPECLKAVRMQLRAGAKVIKICASGGIGSERDNPVDQQFSLEEMKAMVEEATRAQRLVGAHCHGKAGIMAALQAGVKTIEHGSYLDEEAADLMKEKGAILVATRSVVENGLQLQEFWSPAGWEKLKAIANVHWKALQIAVNKGVKIAIGTDNTCTIPGSKIIRQGLNGKELYYHVKAGMTELEVIEAATATGPLTLGPQAPKAGQLKEGYDADFIGLDENPLEDIKVLSGPGHVTHVWRHGHCYKSPGHPVSSL